MNEKPIAFDFESGDFIEEKVKPVQPKKEVVIKEVEEKESKEVQVTSFVGIKVFRYGATDIRTELEVSEEKTYSNVQLVQKLNQAGYYEFNAKNTSFAFNQEKGIISVNIKGNSKG